MPSGVNKRKAHLILACIVALIRLARYVCKVLALETVIRFKDKYAVNAEVDGDYRYRFMMSLNPGTEQKPVAKPTLPTDGL